MDLRRRAAALIAVAVLVPAAWRLTAGVADENPCTDSGASAADPACLTGGTAVQFLRQLCDYQWVPGVCEATGFEDPQYITGTDPSPGRPLQLLVGAVHEHSSYSDGDTVATPADYFLAARTGHNTSRDGKDLGVRLDFVWGSEHSDNGQIPITTSEGCLSPEGAIACAHLGEAPHYWKWDATLRQAREATEYSPEHGYTGFTGIRGFEFTNDYYNHLNVYFSTNFRNVKIDGSYVSPDVFWEWLREPVAEGGGADGLVTFNHPGGDPALTPFDGDLPPNQVLAQVPGGANWNDYAYVPDADAQVAGMEINGGDDLEWYVKALTNGWHIGAVTPEDEHGREWASSAQGKTLLLARGRSPRDHYFAFQNHRTIAVLDDLVGGVPGERAHVPDIWFWADGTSIHDPGAAVLGSTVLGPGEHRLGLRADRLPPGYRVALVSDAANGQAAPLQLGEVRPDGSFDAEHRVTAPADGEDWWFAVVCAPGPKPCGSDRAYSAVTAPIWFRS